MDETVQEALRKGFVSLGFSSHSRTLLPYSDCEMREEVVDSYYEEAERIKKKYRGTIDIYTGIELESRYTEDTRPAFDPRLDYTIGSCHFVRRRGKAWTIDYLPQLHFDALSAYRGDWYALIENYLEELFAFSSESPFDILGHYDLYTKFNEKHPWFDESDKRYRAMALHYADRIMECGKIFEINTGAMARGWTTKPFPAPFIVEHIVAKKGRLMLSSDSHSPDTLDYAFDSMARMLREAGAKEVTVLTKDGFREVEIPD